MLMSVLTAWQKTYWLEDEITGAAAVEVGVRVVEEAVECSDPASLLASISLVFVGAGVSISSILSIAA